MSNAKTDGRKPGAENLRHLLFGATSTLVTTSTMLVGVVLQQTDPSSLWLLVLPIAGVYLAHRAFSNQIREHRRLQLLRQSTELVTDLGTEESISSLLHQIRRTFHAEVAVLTYLPVDVADALALAMSGPDGAEHQLSLVPREGNWEAWAALASGRDPRIISAPAEARDLGELVGHKRLRHAMITPLFGDLNVIGYLMVANRMNDLNAFSSDDLDVLETLERFISMGLENGQLERSLHEARLLERQLVHRVTHDPLTGLANRTLLADHLAQAIEGSRDQGLACLFIDLDDFKSVNDRFGHATGDQMLVVTAQRLVGCLRDGDMAARYGGDELAVIAHVDPQDSLREAAALGRRIIASIGRPASIADRSVTTGASIGIVIARAGDNATDLLSAADAAMYQAKSAGKGRVEVLEPVVRGVLGRGRTSVDVGDRARPR